MTTAQTKRRAILAFMLDRSGVLNKVSMLIRRKMINVDTITACATQQPGISRMTLTLREDSDDKALQLVKQIEKLTEVISAKELDIDQSFWREVAIVKFEADNEHLEQLGQAFNFEILDRQAHEVVVAQVAGTSLMIDNFIDQIGRQKIIEVARSGFTAMEK
ncbi:MAG: acetolactate synthase small subunit [Deltaproteobacteria bacterium]|jgi:acetolactate synthase-1/3 small subunit|nr:acetolactate synthase small subunit [Deltaproteobacteria bacterium]